MPLIDNQNQTMQQALINALSTADKIDIQVGYFYFSGFELLAEHLKNKKVRILVGKQIDPNAVPNIVSMQQKTGKSVDLERFQSWDTFISRTDQKDKYFEGFSRLFNESEVFDSPKSQEAYKIFEQKIIDGTLQIKLTNSDEHGKMYLVFNKPELNQGGDFPGTMFLGSSNFTYNGLIDQGELNKTDRDSASFEEARRKFESMWAESQNIDIATPENNQEFKEVVKRLWINSVIKPHLMYIRVLHELFGKDKNSDIATPSTITNEEFADLEYQLDAIRIGIDRVKQYGGVIIADVVGLGKSIIASAMAHNIAEKERLNVVIICPPHLISQWEEYQASFRLPGTKIFSSGKIADAYSWCTKQIKGPVLLIIDEAHRYRNELTDDYTLLHSIARSHVDNKIVILTATPFNNDPKDVFALVKLFQTPGQSTIRSVDNLSQRFRELIDRYKKLRSGMRNKNLSSDEVNEEAVKIALELRRLIEPVVVRRSRIDLEKISRYRNNLIKQNIAFAKVVGPELLEYELGDLFELYVYTLSELTDPNHGFIGARYKPVTYIDTEKQEEFVEKYSNYLGDDGIRTAQTNLAKFMKRLLIMRFESSKEAFLITLQNIIDSNETILRWYNEHSKVPILKKGKIPDPDTFLQDTGDDMDELTEEIDENTVKQDEMLFVEKDWLKADFIKDVNADIQLLLAIKDKWLNQNHHLRELDPKLDALIQNIDKLLSANPNRKIVVFSAYADTVDYLGQTMMQAGYSRVCKYTAKDASKSNREMLRREFDAGIKSELQSNKYDVLIATDALSEGYNLHRAGVIFNYDIPFNPTRVIQRIGRINRINKKVFDEISVLNFFPTAIGEAETRIQQISTLKMTLINAVVGSDTKTLTSNEELESFFKDEFAKATAETEFESWDAQHRETYDQTPDDIIEEAKSIRPRSRVLRKNQAFSGGIAFGKKGNQAVFAIKRSESDEPEIVSAEEVLPLFVAQSDEDGHSPDSSYNELFLLIRNKLFEKSMLPKISGNRAKALQPLQLLIDQYPIAKDYALDLIKVIKEYDDLSEGQYKLISRIKMDDLSQAYTALQEIVSKQSISTSLKRVDQLDSLSELIVLSEELTA